MFLVCDAVSQESTIKEGPCEFMGESKIRVNLYEFLLLIVSHYYSNFSGHRHWWLWKCKHPWKYGYLIANAGYPWLYMLDYFHNYCWICLSAISFFSFLYFLHYFWTAWQKSFKKVLLVVIIDMCYQDWESFIEHNDKFMEISRGEHDKPCPLEWNLAQLINH